MRKTTIEYACDSCGQDVESQRDLQRFALQLVTHGGRRDAVVMVEFCGDCEARFLSSVEPFFPAEALPRLHAMSREEDD